MLKIVKIENGEIIESIERFGKKVELTYSDKLKGYEIADVVNIDGVDVLNIPEKIDLLNVKKEIGEIDRKISEIESKLQRSLLDVVIGAAFPLELTADDKKENAESKKYLLQYWKDKKELRRQRIEKLKRIEALKNVISR